jgi:hypothetical protein
MAVRFPRAGGVMGKCTWLRQVWPKFRELGRWSVECIGGGA